MSLRVLGLDPGTATFGWGMVESGGERPRYLAHGIITTSPSQSLGERLLQIRTELTQIARSERPDRIAIERLFTQGNLQSAVAVAAARGLALMIAAELLIEVVEATPSEMKRAIAGDVFFDSDAESHFHPQTPSNSRHSPLLMPESSCVTVSPLRRRCKTAIALAESVTPPIR